MEGLEILVGREHIDPRLPMSTDPSMPRVMGHLNLCTCYAGMLDGVNVACCLLSENANGICDIVNFAIAEDYQDKDLESPMLKFVMNSAREKGFRWMEIGTGNAQLDMHLKLQKTGFRVIGAIPDYYQADGRSLSVINGIVNRDMIRYRIDFQDGWVTWTEEVKYRYDQ